MASLHVILARESTRAIIFRRGPSNNWAFIGWDRKDDTFQLGQWIKGRHHPKRGDISPDGEHILYFHCRYRQKEAVNSWTAISRWPFVTAVTFHPAGNSYIGGGLWVDSKRYWLNDWENNRHGVGYLDTSLMQMAKFDPGFPQYGEDMSVYIARLARSGWKFLETVVEKRTGSRYGVTEERDTLIGFRLNRRVTEDWTLCVLCHCGGGRPVGKPCYWDEYWLESAHDIKLSLPDWEWGDVDGSRLVWSVEGRLWMGQVGEGGLEDPKLLADFTDMTFKAIEAPYERKTYVSPKPVETRNAKKNKIKPRKPSRQAKGERR